MKTIAKNRIDKFEHRFANVRVYSLDNGFTGAQADDDARCIAFARKLGAKFSYDAATKKGRARCHSKLWYEFDVRD